MTVYWHSCFTIARQLFRPVSDHSALFRGSWFLSADTESIFSLHSGLDSALNMTFASGIVRVHGVFPLHMGMEREERCEEAGLETWKGSMSP